MYVVGEKPDRIMIHGGELFASESQDGWKLEGGFKFNLGDSVVYKRQYPGLVFQIRSRESEIYTELIGSMKRDVLVTTYGISEKAGAKVAYVREDQLDPYVPLLSRMEQNRMDAAHSLLNLSQQ